MSAVFAKIFSPEWHHFHTHSHIHPWPSLLNHPFILTVIGWLNKKGHRLKWVFPDWLFEKYFRYLNPDRDLPRHLLPVLCVQVYKPLQNEHGKKMILFYADRFIILWLLQWDYDFSCCWQNVWTTRFNDKIKMICAFKYVITHWIGPSTHVTVNIKIVIADLKIYLIVSLGIIMITWPKGNPLVNVRFKRMYT